MKIKPYRVDFNKLNQLRDRSRIGLPGKERKYAVDSLLQQAGARAKQKAAALHGKPQPTLSRNDLFTMKLNAQYAKSGINLVTGNTSLASIAALYNSRSTP